MSVLYSCKTEVAYSECVGRISANKCRPTRQRLLVVDTLRDKGCLQWVLPTGKPYPDRGCWVTSGAGRNRQMSSLPALGPDMHHTWLCISFVMIVVWM